MTVQRYRKMIEDEKSFAITKFAKDLLEVRDAVRLALENTDREQIKANEDLLSTTTTQQIVLHLQIGKVLRIDK